MSVGVTTFGTDASTAEMLVKVADARMYDAKRLGKNRVLVGEASGAHGMTEF